MQIKNTRNKKKLYNFLYWTLVILLIYLSGNIYFMATNYKTAVFAVTFFTIVVYVFRKSYTTKCNGTAFIIIFLSAFFLAIPCLINNETNLSPYIAIFMQIIVAFMAAAIIDFNEFKKIYVNVIFNLAVISLFCFFAFQIYPDIALIFPKTRAIASLDYYNAIVYVFSVPIGHGGIVAFNRNLGIFWEPGAYQAFLNLALFFLLDGIRRGEKIAYKKAKIIILIVTILTTYSTTGYLILLLLIIAFWKTCINNIFTTKKQFVLSIMLAIVFAFCLLGFSNITLSVDRMLIKFATEFSDGAMRALDRISFDKLQYLFLNNSFNFFGMSFSQFEVLEDSCWNSIIHTMICLGIPFSCILLYGYFNFCVKIIDKSLLLFLLFMMIFSTETLFWRPLFLYFVFSGFHTRKKGGICEDIMAM